MNEIEELKQKIAAAETEAKRKTQALESTLTTVSLLYQITSELGLIEDIDQLYKTFLEKVLQLFSIEIGVFYHIETEPEQYRAFLSLGLRHNEEALLTGPFFAGTLFEEVILKRGIRLVSTKEIQLVNPVFRRYPIAVTLMVPVETKAGVVAVLQLSRLYDEPFFPEDERVFRILLSKLSSSLEAASAQDILRKKTNELERMNKLMVDRELKMIELKKQIAELLAERK